jgi:hypothetical protein
MTAQNPRSRAAEQPRCLQRFTDASERHAFDPLKGEVSMLTAGGPAPKVIGYIDWLGGIEARLYASRGKLIFEAGGSRCALGPGVSATFERGAKKTLRLKIAAGDVHELVYKDPVDPPMEDDFTAADEEDFDLGLFVHNVANAPERQAFLLGKWG